MTMVMMVTVVSFFSIRSESILKKWRSTWLFLFCVFCLLPSPFQEWKQSLSNWVSIEYFIHMIKTWLRHYLRHKDDKLVLKILWNESSSESAHFLFYVFVLFWFVLSVCVCVCVCVAPLLLLLLFFVIYRRRIDYVQTPMLLRLLLTFWGAFREIFCKRISFGKTPSNYISPKR